MLRVLAFKGRATRAAVLLLTVALLNLSSPATRASTVTTTHAGEVTLANGVAVDGSQAVRGQTFFTGSRFEAADKSQTLLSLDNLGRVELSDRAALKLDFDGAALGGALETGRLRVYAPRGVAADFATSDAHVRSDSREAASFYLRAGRGFTEVSVQAGSLEVRAGASSRLVKAGESYATAPDPQSQQNSSGRKRAGIILAVAAAVAIVAVVLTARDEDEMADFGGCVIVLSPGAPNTCP